MQLCYFIFSVERALTAASARWIGGGSPWVIFFLEEHERKDDSLVLPLCGRTGGVDGRRRMAARPPHRFLGFDADEMQEVEDGLREGRKTSDGTGGGKGGGARCGRKREPPQLGRGKSGTSVGGGGWVSLTTVLLQFYTRI